MPGQSEFVDMMRRAAAISLPDLDTTIGSTARKIFDIVGEVAAATSADEFLLGFPTDIDTRTGVELENFVRSFGFTRLPAKRATGTVTFERQTAATQAIIIPRGTQVSTDTSPPILAVTVVPGVIPLGEDTIEIPVQAIIPGSAGNVVAFAIQRAVQPIGGVSSFSNPLPLTGGADAESDDLLRQRFKRTAFRNHAGTEAMYLGTALENDAVTRANVIGSSKRRREQVEIVAGAATSTVQDAVSVYVNSESFGADLDNGDVLTPGIHYDFDFTQTPPVVTILDAAVAPDGIYDLEFEYLPRASRNDVAAGITNRVDVYLDGVVATEATETRLFSDSVLFDHSDGSLTNIDNFERTNGSAPQVGNIFLALTFSPVLDPSISNHITVGPTVYDEGSDYFLVNDISNRGGAPQSLSGIEWVSVANGATKAVPTNGLPFLVDYVFNVVPRQVEIALREWRLLSQDVWVHQARTVWLNFYVAVILELGFSSASVLSGVEQELRTLVGRTSFDSSLQVSDVIQAIHNVPGVDAVRFLTLTDDPGGYAIQRVAADGVTVLQIYATGGRVKDVTTDDDEVLAFHAVTMVVKAANTFGTG